MTLCNRFVLNLVSAHHPSVPSDPHWYKTRVISHFYARNWTHRLLPLSTRPFSVEFYEELRKNKNNKIQWPALCDCGRNSHWNGIHAVTVNHWAACRQIAATHWLPFMSLYDSKTVKHLNVISPRNRQAGKGEANMAEMYAVLFVWTIFLHFWFSFADLIRIQ